MKFITMQLSSTVTAARFRVSPQTLYFTLKKIMGKFADKIYNNGPAIGFCNICGKHRKLTRDHVPPKGSVKICEVELRTLVGHFSANQTKPSRLSQNGVNFRTICSVCNNEELGANYDPSLIEMVNSIGCYLKAEKELNLIIPSQTKISVQPQRVARAVVGHLLAFTNPKHLTKPPLESPYHDALREYFLNPQLSMPDRLDIYHWVYPSNVQVLINFHSVGVRSFKHLIMGSLMKFFPIGFWAVWDKPNEVNLNIPKLVENKQLGIDNEMSLSVNFKGIPRVNWPETPDSDGAILSSEGNSILATQRKIRGKKNKLHLPR